MASAVIATRNETSWPNNPFLMTKIPFSNNPNPKHQNGDVFSMAATDDAASFSHREDIGSSFSHYVYFDVSGLTKSDSRSLRARLVAELERVRSLTTRIESGETRNPKKRPMPFQPMNKETKRFNSKLYVSSAQLMKICGQIVSKLMKQKASYVFNTPVDVVGLGLHDYHQIVKRPMDLGTIKKNLGRNLYPTPEEFGSDVRLTFSNALKYNPKGHEVHVLAEQFLSRFEESFRPVLILMEKEKEKFRVSKGENRVKDDSLLIDVVAEVQGSSWGRHPSPKIVPNVPKKERVEPPPPPPPPPPVVAPVIPAPPAMVPVRVPSPEVVQAASGKGAVGRALSGKLPKPKAKDPNKRGMSLEEKHKLGAGLQSLPEEKMAQVIQIIRKRNGHLTQDGDEIELDIEAVDTETLWELDRFVTNYKKMESKIRRQGLLIPAINNVGHRDSNQVGGGMNERVTETGKAKKGVGGDAGEEDVDIGDEMPVNNYPPLEIEKDDDRQVVVGVGGGGGSSGSSSSSSSDDSSSSDSDTGSSSGSDSDVDDAQSRDNESKNIQP